ncbi:MAG TPA: SPOCS domain-containing protein [Clostridia bacterium]|nr:SPOCS domain-containing protein [Clostridia bacterium]
MSLDLIREAVRLNQPIGEDTTQAIVENDIIVPDIKPDIARILLLDGDAFVNGVETASDKINISGTVRYKILYISDDPEQPVKSINTSSGFRYTMDIPDARQGMQSRVKCDIEHLEYDILNSRKVNVKAILNLHGRVSSPIEQYITRDFSGIEDVQVLRSTISVNSYIGECSVGCPVRETLELPAGKPTVLEILRNDAKVSGKEYKVSDGKLAVKGELNVSTLYIADDETRSIQFMEHEVPFTQLVDLPGVDEDSFCNVDIDLGELSFEAEEDADGELRLLKCETQLDIYAESFGKKDIELVEDAYSPSSRMSLEKEQLMLDELVSDNKGQVTLKDTIMLDDSAPDISELFNILGKLSISGSEITEDRIVVEGVVASNILYLANNQDQPVCCADREIPFRHSLDVKGAKAGMGLDVEMDIEHCSYSIISSKEIEVRYNIALNTRVSRQVAIPVISKAFEQPLDDKRLLQQPSVTIYFAQQDDTLWKVAKKYYTTVDELRKNNGFEDSVQLAAGEQILIPRKL